LETAGEPTEDIEKKPAEPAEPVPAPEVDADQL
jgi:hypothetical protein